MHDLVAFPTKRDQVGLRVVSLGASPSHMMDVQIPEGSTFLTTPTVAFQDHATQRRIWLWSLSNSSAKPELVVSWFLQDLGNCDGDTFDLKQQTAASADGMFCTPDRI